MAEEIEIGPVVSPFDHGTEDGSRLLVCYINVQRGTKYRGGFAFSAEVHEEAPKRFGDPSAFIQPEELDENYYSQGSIFCCYGEGYQEWSATLALIAVLSKWSSKGSPRAFLERWFYRLAQSKTGTYQIHMQILCQKSAPPSYVFDKSSYRTIEGWTSITEEYGPDVRAMVSPSESEGGKRRQNNAFYRP